MGVREAVVEQLRRGECVELAGQAVASPRVLRAVLGRLWDDEAKLRAGAAITLGELAARRPDTGVELVRRFFWALNDESGTNGGAVLPALAAMARSAPAVVGPFAGALVAHLDDEGLRGQLIEVLTILHERDSRWTAPHAAELSARGVNLSDGLPPGGEEVEG